METFHFFNRLIRHGRLSRLWEEFSAAPEPTESFDHDSNTLTERFRDPETGEWRVKETSFKERLYQGLLPAYDEVLARLEKDYKSKRSDEESMQVGRYYLKRLDSLKGDLSAYSEKKGRTLVKKALDRLTDEVLERGPDVLSKEYDSIENFISRRPTKKDLGDPPYEEYPQEHIRFVRTIWPDIFNKKGKLGKARQEVRDRFLKRFGEELGEKTKDGPGNKTIRRWTKNI